MDIFNDMPPTHPGMGQAALWAALWVPNTSDRLPRRRDGSAYHKGYYRFENYALPLGSPGCSDGAAPL